MQVKLLEHTPNAAEVIYSAARQCYSNEYAGDMYLKKAKNKQAFIKQIIESGHTSVIEHVTFTFAVDGISRSCTHQLVRHRLASYSQQSQRYCKLDSNEKWYITPSSIKNDGYYLKMYDELMQSIANFYKSLVDNKIPAEDARFILPNATKTSIVVTMNCRSLLNFFEHRCCNRAQWEIRGIANLMLKICQSVLPEVFSSAGAKCERSKLCPEGKKFTCGKYPSV